MTGGRLLMLAYYRKRGIISTAVFLICGVLLLIVRWITGGEEPGADIFILFPMGAAFLYALWCFARGTVFRRK